MPINTFFKLKEILPKKYFYKLIILIVILLINSIFEIFSLSLLIPLFDILKDNNNLFLNFVNEIAFLSYFHNNKAKLILLIISLIIVVFAIKMLISLISIRYSQFLIANLKTELSHNIFYNYLLKDYLYFKNKKSSEIIRNLIKEVGEFCERFIFSLINIFLDFFIIIGILIFLVYQVPIDVIFLTIYSLIFFFIFYLLNKEKLFNAGKFRQNLDEKKFSVLTNFTNNLKQIKILNEEEIYLENFKKFTYKFEKIFAKFVITALISRPIFEFLIILFLSLLFFYKIKSDFEIIDIIYSLTILAAGSIRILPSLSRLMFNLGQLIFSFPSVEVIYNETLNLKKNNNLKVKKKKIINFNKKIVLDNINFKFQSAQDYLFKNLSLSINKGDKICFTGKSGIGKSTLIEIIVGLIRPNSGSLIIDGRRFDFDNDKLNVSYISQETFLFDDTIKKNIILNSAFDNDRFEKAIKFAELDDFISKNAEKENYLVGAFGDKISGGQRQRVALARCFYNRTNLIIFDEPFTALDDYKKFEIQKNIFNYFNNETIIFISHDKEIIKSFNKVINIEQLL
jgi:ABC-type bacteriocin/lantibiotic exporter with double-glycine peptidase domain